MYIRKATNDLYESVGELLVHVYQTLDGFPKESEQPHYYQLLREVGELTTKPGVEIFVALNDESQLCGAVVYFGEMAHYGSGGSATREKNAAGFRLLAVDSKCRGLGIGKLLTQKCIERTVELNLPELIIHSTKAMHIAWGMYERMGFKRSEDLDFKQEGLPVFGFRLLLRE